MRKVRIVAVAAFVGSVLVAGFRRLWRTMDRARWRTRRSASEVGAMAEEQAPVELGLVAEEPVAEEPAAAEEPASEEPAVVEEPVAGKPAVPEEPAAEKAVAAEPVTMEPEAGEGS